MFIDGGTAENIMSFSKHMFRVVFFFENDVLHGQENGTGIRSATRFTACLEEFLSLASKNN